MADESVVTQQKSEGNSQMWFSLIAIIIGTFVAVLNSSLMNVAMNKFVAVFGSDLTTMQWIITGYTLASAMVIPMSGYLGARFGNKNLFIYSVAGFTVFSVLCGLAWSANTMIIFRIIQGFAGGFIMPVGMSIIFTTFPKEKTGTAMGLWGIAAMVAPALGPTFGGYLIQNFSWRILFFINVPIGILAVVLGKILMKESPRTSGLKFDTPGAILSMIFFGSLLLALSKGQSLGWTSLFIVSLLFVAFFSLVLLIWVELGTKQPVLDLYLFKNLKFTVSVIAGSLVMVGMMGGTFLAPVYLQSIQGLTAMQTGMLLMPQSIAMAVMMAISGKLADRFGIVPICIAGLTILGVTTLQLHQLTADTPTGWFNLILSIRGIGIGVCMMPLTSAGMNAVTPQQVGNASPLSNVCRQVAGSLGIAIFTAIMSSRQVIHYQHISESVPIDSYMANSTISSLTGAIYAWAVDMATASGTATSYLAGFMQKEAYVRSIADTFFISAIPAFVCIPFVLLFITRKKAPVEVKE
ncbi:DHA2 family efflux MFS transporter permease subunit [Paenibacillus aceris]|uniref:EmrB/QacA subfamily drug resistance transporter n=1 Tax=Paenibacillus aceris TaxID=869555 RepID=A0ABS4HW97_9BACL|nr:DHA2 family efflux MFS transporter permease subunit [Paenibacillus aceris]MBP1962926.1 EmrB/QacA subfamily drug resistance transporter [Paenibacillus aceris]NHW38352.1 DHA2 family efflux MFS transporter permease subunit [Paenibacillus aceris]